MQPPSQLRSPRARRTTSVIAASLAVGMLAACASSSSSPAATPGTATTQATNGLSTAPPSPDPRVGLEPGRDNAGVASWNLRLVSNTPPAPDFVGVTNSDLAFTGNYVIQGNYNGIMVWDVSNPVKPTLKTSYLCPASQSDVSVYRNLLFVSGEGQTGRLDCGTQGVPEPVSHDRLRGIRIFDATDIANPKYVANVQTCRGSHTHTVVSDPDDPANVYIYVSGSSRIRSPDELPGCSDAMPNEDPNSSRFRIEVIQVPLNAPQNARIVSSPRIFNDLDPAPRRYEPPNPNRQRQGPERVRTGPEQCHDITVYPAIGLAGGACGGYGLLLDISDAANPKRLAAVADTNFSFWHSATFSNDGDKILFTDEWGGGRAPRCRETDNYNWGADAIFTLENNQMEFKSYYKMPAAQTEFENCVAHNGSLIPIPGREVMVQGWYQGGISIFDWTDPMNPKEIAFFDRGPLDGTQLTSAGSWSVYWYNGSIYSSEIARGLDVFQLTPSAFISQNEIDAARTVHFEQLNAQEQPQMVWPASFALARAYLDQLERGNGLAAARITAVRNELAAAERLSGQARSQALTALSTQLHTDANSARDSKKAHTLAAAVGELAAAR